MTFRGHNNFHTEVITFEIMDFLGAYHTILGRLCYAKFMAVPNYTYLKLKIPEPWGIITVDGGVHQAHLYKRENCDIMIEGTVTPKRGGGELGNLKF